MRPDDPLNLPAGSPYDDYDGPRGFADVGGGYPVEEDTAEAPRDGAGRQTSPAAEADPPDRPASPVAGRRLHNPLPGSMPVDDDDWYGPEPERAPWRMIAPIAVLAACAGIGVWLAVPSATEQTAQPLASPTPEQALSRRPVQDPATTWWPTPTPRASSRTPAGRRTPTPSTTPTPTLSRASSPPASQRSTIRPFPTRPPQPSPKPTVTVTKKVTIAPKPTRTRTRHAGGPEEPPGGSAHPTTGAQPSPTCVTWGDCHDDPPKG
ncbi:hypothetical protein ACWDRB_66515 [Nonomuraea sp. NPDC003707]